MKIQSSIPPFRLIPEALNEEARKLEKFKWADKLVGSRHQLGGNPSFLQREELPICPCCHNKMIFYAQLDSINDDYVIADCGMIYVFICFDCNETRAVIQSS